MTESKKETIESRRNDDSNLEFEALGHQFIAKTKEGKKEILHTLLLEQLEGYHEIKRGEETEQAIENIRAEDALEYVYELSDEWKDIEEMKRDLRSMIRYFKDEKFGTLSILFRPSCLYR